MWKRKLAFRYIKGNKDTWISVAALLAGVGMALGVAILITVISLMEGFKHELVGKMLTTQGHVNIQGNITDYQAIKNQLMKEKGVKGVVPVFEQQCIVKTEASDQMQGVLVHGKMQADLPFPVKDNEIIIGKTLAENLNAKVGDEIELVTNTNIQTPFGSASSSGVFVIKHIIKHALIQYDGALCLMNLGSLQELADNQQSVSNILVYLHDINKAIAFKIHLGKLLKYQIHSWKDLNLTFAQVINTQRNIVFIIVSLMIIIASFNGISSLLMLVKEKTKEIAILKIMGAKERDILTIFLIIGLTISTISVSSGILVGVMLSLHLDKIRLLAEQWLNVNLLQEEFYNMNALPVFLSPYQITMIAAWCLFIAALGIIYPCRKALKVDANKELRVQ